MEKTAWDFARAVGRDYITPEDIGDALASGTDPTAVKQEVLEALGKKSCEDPSLCAFVASKDDGDPIELWKRIVLDDIQAIDPRSDYDPFVLALGFFLGRGFAAEEAHELALKATRFDIAMFNRLSPSRAKDMLVGYLVCCFAESKLDCYGNPQFGYADALRLLDPEPGSYLSSILHECFELVKKTVKTQGPREW